MKTTLDLPDELLIEAKATAARRRTTLRAIVVHALHREIVSEVNMAELGDLNACIETGPNGLPRFKREGKGTISSEAIYKLMEEEGI